MCCLLLVDIPEHQLRIGDGGTVVDVHSATSAAPDIGYSVEFATMSGDTTAVLDLEAGDIRAVRSTDIAHVREAASASKPQVRH